MGRKFLITPSGSQHTSTYRKLGPYVAKFGENVFVVEPHRRIMFFCDSSVCVGAFSKGRSSSFKLNVITRACLGHTVLGFFELALIWASTHLNPADFPSRNIPLPPPGPIPEAYRQYFTHGPWKMFVVWSCSLVFGC